MAASQQISFGLGSPASIAFLMTFGLTSGAVAPIVTFPLITTTSLTSDQSEHAIASQQRLYQLESEQPDYTIG